MKLYFLILLNFTFIHISCSQQSKAIYQEGLKISLQKMVIENPDDKYYLKDYYTTFDVRAKLSDLLVICDLETDSFKQSSEEKETISIPKEYRKYFKNNNFFNRLIYGKKLRSISVSNLYYDNSKKLLTLRVRNNEDQRFVFIVFNEENKKIYECEEHYIF